MILIEPTNAYFRRTQPLTPPPLPVALTAKEITAISMLNRVPQPPADDDLRELILEILEFEGQYPVRITEIVNRAASWTPLLGRREREQVKLSAFRMLGRMIRAGILRRVSRNCVQIEPNWVEQQNPPPCADPAELPEPRV